MLRTKYYFISDAHLGAESAVKSSVREEKLVAFCDFIKDSAKGLYLLGDIFDFWFEYGPVVPSEHFKVIAALHNLSRTGTRIVYVGGNHDFWDGDFLTREAGIEVFFEPVTVNLDGKRILLHHGNGVLKSDWSHAVLKMILRNRINARLYRLIPPAIGLPIAKAISRASRHWSDTCVNNEKVTQDYRQAAERFLENPDIDAVILAHTHFADLQKIRGKTYANTGNWLKDFNYLILEDGEFSLKKY